MTKEEVFDEINYIQDFYIDELVSKIYSLEYLHINRVIVYDATSDKSVVANISDNKWENYATS